MTLQWCAHILLRQWRRKVMPQAESPEGRNENNPMLQHWVWRRQNTSPEGTADACARGSAVPSGLLICFVHQLLLRCLLFLLLALAFTSPALATDSSHAKALFKNPSREFSTGPLWVWNDMLTEQQVRETLRDLAGQHIQQAWVHPRPGLMTPYLSNDWFRLWRVALDEAKRLGMKLWIYDEDSYPSGFAGGWVPELMPESRGRGLDYDQTNQPPAWSSDILGVFLLKDDQSQNVTAELRAGNTLPADKYLIVKEVRTVDSPWHGNRCYVNLLTPGVTENFLDVTMNTYRRELGDNFGKAIPGVFSDEPNIYAAGRLPWCEDLPKQFQQRWGYSVLEHLDSLFYPVGDWQRVRHNFFQVLNALFIERWAKPYHDYCERNHLQWTGHYWDHEWPNCVYVPDNMAVYPWPQLPGIDCLQNRYEESCQAQFGNMRIVRELASVANQLGRPRTFCEAYGGASWDVRFEDLKRIGDWLEVLGINTINQHLSFITIRGARKRDNPQSFSYHEPWWEAYHISADYFARLSAAMSQGEQRNHILLLEPTTTAWMYQGDSTRLKALGDDFFGLIQKLEAAQIEYDIGSEDILAKYGSVVASQHGKPQAHGEISPSRPSHISSLNLQLSKIRAVRMLQHQTTVHPLPFIRGEGRGEGLLASGVNPVVVTRTASAQLKVGQRLYSTVILPASTDNLNARTVRLLSDFSSQTGTLLCLSNPPNRIDGLPSTRGQALASTRGFRRVETDQMVDLLTADSQRHGFAIHRTTQDKGILFHHRRQMADGQLLFLVNTSTEFPSTGTFEAQAGGIEQWDPYAGNSKPYPFARIGSEIQASFSLTPFGSVLLFLPNRRLPTVPAPHTQVTELKPLTGIEVKRLQPNVLTIDYVDVTAGGETRTNFQTYRANQFVWKQNGMERNPWDSAVQFKDELISKTFPPGSGFEATYRFRIQDAVPKSLEIVIERPDLYSISCNGQPVIARPGAWWLDKAFGRLDIAAAARCGENEVTIKASPFTMFHELEAAYLLGDFGVSPVANGFVLTATRDLLLDTSLPRQGWNLQGHPFYSSCVSYRQQFKVAHRHGQFVVNLPDWNGSVAKVNVNGKFAGYIDAPPSECDVTKFIHRGTNDIDVIVIGTLKNTLGPHHGNLRLGAAWPTSFQKGPEVGQPAGTNYTTVPYGLFKPFTLQSKQAGKAR
jgi:hypothetical protein